MSTEHGTEIKKIKQWDKNEEETVKKQKEPKEGPRTSASKGFQKLTNLEVKLQTRQVAGIHVGRNSTDVIAEQCDPFLLFVHRSIRS